MNLRKQVEYNEINQASVFGSCASGCLASFGKAIRTILQDVKNPHTVLYRIEHGVPSVVAGLHVSPVGGGCITGPQ